MVAIVAEAGVCCAMCGESAILAHRLSHVVVLNESSEM